MVNTITDNENINKGGIIKEVLDERIENFEKISKNKDLDFKSKIQKLIFNLEFKLESFKKDFGYIEFINFFEFILEKFYNYLIFTYREEKSIENIEKYFPKNQKQIPIIFGAGHNRNWKKIVEEHNEKNKENHYSLKIINFGPKEFDK